MKTLTEIKQMVSQHKSFLIQHYGIKNIGIFGSYVRNEQTSHSDIDILVDLKKPVQIDLIGFIEMENYLTDLFGVKVDVVIRDDLKPRIGKHILNEVVMV